MGTIIATALCALATLAFCVVRGADIVRHRMAAMLAEYQDPRRHHCAIALAFVGSFFWLIITVLMLDRVAALAMAPA